MGMTGDSENQNPMRRPAPSASPESPVNASGHVSGQGDAPGSYGIFVDHDLGEEYHVGIDWANGFDTAVAFRKLADGSLELVSIVQHDKAAPLSDNRARPEGHTRFDGSREGVR